MLCRHPLNEFLENGYTEHTKFYKNSCASYFLIFFPLLAFEQILMF